jgi:hypothetical protein
MMMPTSSSVLVVASYVALPLITLRSVQREVILFCKCLDDPHHEWFSLVGLLMTDNFDTEWDDSCSGLVETLAREAEWKAREVNNDVVQWGVSAAMDG